MAKSFNNSSRLQILENGIERLLKLRNAEIIKHKGTKKEAINQNQELFKTAIQQSLKNNIKLSPKAVAPYKEFLKGSYIGYEMAEGSVHAVVSMSKEIIKNSKLNDSNYLAAKFTLNHVTKGFEKTRWFTLETLLDNQKIKSLPDKISLEILCDFEFFDDDSPDIANTIKTTLRSFNEGGGYYDFDIGHFPVVSVPYLNQITFDSKKNYQNLISQNVTNKLIFWLPRWGKYNFNLYSIKFSSAV